MGDRSKIKIPKDLKTIDAAGKYVMPGLVGASAKRGEGRVIGIETKCFI